MLCHMRIAALLRTILHSAVLRSALVHLVLSHCASLHFGVFCFACMLLTSQLCLALAFVDVLDVTACRLAV